MAVYFPTLKDSEVPEVGCPGGHTTCVILFNPCTDILKRYPCFTDGKLRSEGKGIGPRSWDSK